MTKRLWYLVVGIALIASCATTTAGGERRHGPPGTCSEERTDGCGYAQYGWPWAWKTDAPPELIIAGTDHGSFFAMDPSGWAPGVFYFTMAVWFSLILAVELAIAGVVFGIRQVRGGRLLSPD